MTNIHIAHQQTMGIFQMQLNGKGCGYILNKMATMFLQDIILTDKIQYAVYYCHTEHTCTIMLKDTHHSPVSALLLQSSQTLCCRYL